MEEQEKSKYYTPAIEDLFVGYRCERLTQIHGEYSKPEDKPIVEWLPSIFTIFNIGRVSDLSPTVLEQTVRTPYLTKEQIEAEGWVLKGDIYEKGDYDILTGTVVSNGKVAKKPFMVYNRKWKTQLFVGICPSINEFRKITKLLGI